jgi:predicted Zn-dependent peptidase
MQRSKSIQALINKAKKDFVTLKTDYESSLQHQSISEELKVDIKNIFENLRSCLDYLAHDIHQECVGGATPSRLYFPIRQTAQEFTQAINRDFPNLDTGHNGVYTAIEKEIPGHPPLKS